MISEAYPQLTQKDMPMFVTLYDQNTVVASAGRLYPMSNSAEELLQSTIHAIEDPRFESYKNNPEKIQSITVRIDTFEDSDRRLLHHPDDLRVGEEGMIIICRSQKKV